MPFRSGLHNFMHKGRLEMSFEGHSLVRAIHSAEILRRSDVGVLDAYMAERAPYYYKEPAEIANLFGKGYFLDAIKSVLRRLPTAQNFRSSHFGEILAGVYAEEVLHLKRLYSKLALLTAENANALKMDMLLYRPGCNPAEFVFAEVKSSMKTEMDGLPAGHDRACFADLFDSFNRYGEKDRDYDLAAVQERLAVLPEPDRGRIADALLPYRDRKVRYAGFCVIDRSTHDQAECRVLGTRRNDRRFEVDVLCVAELPEVVSGMYETLERLV